MLEINDLFRRIRNIPQYIKSDGTISSAIYLDSNGVSVDADDKRILDEIIKDEERLHYFYNQGRTEDELKGPYKLAMIASVDKNSCVEKNIHIEPSPIEGENPYHVLLKRSESQIPLSGSQRKHLQKNTKIVKKYDIDVVKE